MKAAIRTGLCVVAMLAAGVPLAGANNLQIENVSLRNLDTGAKKVDVVFNLSWENSWRTAENHDAAWIFVKFRPPGSNVWEHARLSTVSGDHTPSAGSTILAVPDGRGVFVYPSAGYTGNVNYAAMRLRWTYNSNGYDFAKGSMIDFSVHAIEMVYVPGGAFCIGSGGAESGRFYQYTDGFQTTQSFLVASEDAIAVGMVNERLYYTGAGDGVGPVSNAFPKGYAPVYCMKYPITQGQYVAFLRELTQTQWTTRNTAGYFGLDRHTISGTAPTNTTTLAPDRACNYLSWAHVCAYLDWAALRPMTELEYEKICRGSALPVPNEYAWGTISRTVQTGHNEADGVDSSGRERAVPSNANCNDGTSTIKGPVRVGIYATTNSTRVSSGATYYGVMHMTCNVYERVITIGSALERGFRGTLGDGLLAANGNATNPDWPGITGGIDDKVGYRGGGSSSQSQVVPVSWRYRGGEGHAIRLHAYGGRGVRQVP